MALHSDPGHLLRRAQQNASKQFRTILGPHRLTPIQYGVLRGLQELGPCIQRHLSAYVGIDPANLHEMLKRMETRELIIIELNPESNRRELISLTQDSEKLLAELIPKIARANEALAARLNEEEQQHFPSILKKLAGI